MDSFKRKVYKKMLSYGLDPIKFINKLKYSNIEWFEKDFEILKKQKGNDHTFKIGKINPVLNERNEEGGTMNGHYFHQDLYVARLIFLANPRKHLDIGSRTDGFVAHVASFREIELIDIRNIESNVTNIVFRKANLIELPTDLIDYCDSISSLHAIEHFGLGRYGDPIDYFGYLKAINNITKILNSNGIFYFSVPIGEQRIEFNSHRVFSIKYLIDLFSDNFTIKSFSYVNDNGDFFENSELSDQNIKLNFNCEYGCGIFVLVKK